MTQLTHLMGTVARQLQRNVTVPRQYPLNATREAARDAWVSMKQG